MWQWILLLMTLSATITDGRYTGADIRRIVQDRVMQFHNFPEQGRQQYGVILLLPPFERTQPRQQLPEIRIQGPAQRIQDHSHDMLLGVNYAVARPSNGGGHTETQLLTRLPDLLHTYKGQYNNRNPTILLYTRGTPCTDCTNALEIERYCTRYSLHQDQFVVAYSTNMENNYMSPTLNCKNRNYLWRKNIEVYCVQEPQTNQCRENDNIPCRQHNRRYSWRHTTAMDSVSIMQ